MKMNMKLKLKNILVIASVAMLACGSFSSCESYLDVDKYFYDMTSLDSIFARKELLTKYINEASSLLPKDDRLWTNAETPFSFTSDEAFCSWNDNRHAGIKYPLGEVDRFYVHNDVAWTKNWSRFYMGIRKANLVIERIRECKDITEMERRDFTGQAYFLRGYLYYCLLRQYGPVPILPDQAFETNESSDAMSQPRNTYDECVEYICNNLETASTMLDTSRSAIETFRIPTAGAALALISRIRLEAASPWFNGNLYYSDFLRSSDGVPYISQTKDINKWAIAAVAAKRTIDLGESGSYALYTVAADGDTPPLAEGVPNVAWPNGPAGIDHFKSYSDIFTGEESALNIPEVIWACDETTDLSWICFPSVAMGGGNGLCVSQKIVDAYRMIDGRDINHSSDAYPYIESGDESGTAQSFSGYQLRKTVAKMYANREMRFYASIGFNHAFWEGSSYQGTAANAKNLEVTYYRDGTGGANADHPEDRTMSGYTSRKYIHYSDNPKGTYRFRYFPIIRYAEILLNYVEAMNEMKGSYTDEATGITVSHDPEVMRKYFNLIRFRAGLPGITMNEAEDQETMRDLIKRERQVEFAFEGRRFYDLRRWGDLLKEVSEPFTGMNVDATTSERSRFHIRTTMTYRYSLYLITNRLAFCPIRQTTIDKNPKLDQNPGW